jgi:hypothetical protein
MAKIIKIVRHSITQKKPCSCITKSHRFEATCMMVKQETVYYNKTRYENGDIDR